MLENSQPTADPIDAAAAKYKLTPREGDVLRGVLTGLNTKELATFLNVRHSTTKTFLRLVMLKMGATCKADIVAKIYPNFTVSSRTIATKSRRVRRLAS